MDDKTIMEDILLNIKTACNLYLHGTIESSTAKVHSAFDCALNDTLKMQNQVFQKMSSKGWYPMEQEEQQKIQQVKETYSSQQGMQGNQGVQGNQGMQSNQGMQGNQGMQQN